MSHQDRSYLKTQIETTESDIRGADSDTLKTLDDKIDVIDGFHDVPTADAATDTVIRDVVGRKTDTANTTVGTGSSLMRYIKGILNTVLTLATPTNITAGTITTVTNLTNAPTAGDLTATMKTSVTTAVPTVVQIQSGLATQASVDTIDGYHDVPVADATTDAVMRDVIGRKTDAAVTTVGVVASIIAYVKGILNRIGAPAGASIAADIVVIDGYHDVPTADVTTDTVIRDVVGRKTDTANVTVGTGSSLMRYIKGLLNELAKVPKSDSTVTWNATALASVNAEVDTALNTAVPLTPTANSLNDILSKLDGANTFDNTTDSLEAIRDKVDTLPTAGAVVSTASATTTGVIVENGATGTPNVVAVSSAASANTFGSWVELDASASADSWLCSMFLHCTSNSAAERQVFEIGTGAASSEATKTRHSCNIVRPDLAGYKGGITFAFPIPIKVASGTRIAVRVADGSASAINYEVSVQMYQTLET